MEDIVLIKIYDRISKGEKAALVTITDENGESSSFNYKLNERFEKNMGLILFSRSIRYL
ncbi:hypothetical protein H7E67_09220 [Clostridium gasigenes]|uniref:hypothetical protein n=1 Tax=Clostridium gasigenes TaxID=94869 RepID=UPI0016233FFA|nr:hypothetical protein [Clostridium gasigenes]MBB6623608.1 hypothetical protein [Clostridium gasigenes]MBU3087591.1 hypothetical protein [Clostridium gasigenes]MBU3131794.1 hypothetical protein [Clostridium gasigenes]MBU3135266.1 hypothetical protein [Clostridium gasigenes]